jgi:hypothetical protein
MTGNRSTPRGPAPDWLSVEEYAAVYGLGRQTGYAQVRLFVSSAGREGMPCELHGKQYRISRYEIERRLGGPITWPIPATTPSLSVLSPNPASDSLVAHVASARLTSRISRSCSSPDTTRLSTRGDPHDPFTNLHHGAGGGVRITPAVPAVLSVWKLAHGQEAYYLESVAQGVEDYYVGGEAPGRWIASSDTIGLAGTVSPEDLRAVLSGGDPSAQDTARSAAQGAWVRSHVPGAEVRVRVVRTR